MRGKNKKKTSMLDRKNLLVLAMAAAFVAAIAFVMSSLLPAVENNDRTFDQAAWDEAVKEAENSLEEKVEAEDTGLTSVYNEDVVSTSSNAIPVNTESESTEEQSETKAANDKSVSDNFIAPLNSNVLNDYSGEELVYSKTMQDWRTHNGIDFAADEGTDVYSAADGTIEAITDNSLLGTTIIILHNNGIRSIYANLSDNPSVEIGAKVTQGAPIGKVGSSAALEAAEPPHLHFEMSLNEECINPHDYISL